MPPKKAKPKQVVTKKTPQKCHHNTRGYCKAKDDCANEHSDKVCEDPDCLEDNCKYRHPNPCKYGFRCRFNKKEECMYLHEDSITNVVEIKALKTKFETLENIMKKMATDLETKDLEIELLKGNQIKLENILVENETDVIKKELEAKNAKINGLEIRLSEIERCHQTFKKHQENKIKDLENQAQRKKGKVVLTEVNKIKENNFKCRE